MKIEIERKFLLKSLPKLKPQQSIKIDQYYLKTTSGVWERARTWESSPDETKYIHTIKKSVSKGVNIEDEHYLSKEEFESFKTKCLQKNTEAKFIEKVRHIFPDGDLFWEVDIFGNGYELIIAEIEIPKKTYKLILPDFIKEVNLLEVTGLKQFSNRSLSLKITK